MGDPQGSFSTHDKVHLDHISRSIVVHDTSIDRLDLLSKSHRFVNDQLLEFERGGSSGEVVEMGSDRVTPDEDEDDWNIARV